MKASLRDYLNNANRKPGFDNIFLSNYNAFSVCTASVKPNGYVHVNCKSLSGTDSIGTSLNLAYTSEFESNKFTKMPASKDQAFWCPVDEWEENIPSSDGKVRPVNPKIGDVVCWRLSSWEEKRYTKFYICDDDSTSFFHDHREVINGYGKSEGKQHTSRSGTFHRGDNAHHRLRDHDWWVEGWVIEKPKPQVCKGRGCPEPVQPWAMPNQPDGTFLCYSCRSVWRPK